MRWRWEGDLVLNSRGINLEAVEVNSTVASAWRVDYFNGFVG
jgi:hypothetical protein